MSEKTDLPDGVAQVVLSNGIVMANVTQALLDRGLGLGVGNDEVRFEPVGEEDDDLPELLIEYRPRFDPEDLQVQEFAENGRAFAIRQEIALVRNFFVHLV